MTQLDIIEPAARNLAHQLVEHAYALSVDSWLALATVCTELAAANAALDCYGAER